MTDQQDIFSPDKARAFNPFLCARTDNLMALIAEAPRDLPADDLRDRNAAVP